MFWLVLVVLVLLVVLVGVFVSLFSYVRGTVQVSHALLPKRKDFHEGILLRF